MDSIQSELAARAFSLHQSQRAKSSSKHARTLITLAGPPGSGKTTVAAAVVRLLNTSAGRRDFAVVVPMDGFHLPRSALDALPNRDEAYARRGAAWTFDAKAVLDLVNALRRSKTDQQEDSTQASNDEGKCRVENPSVHHWHEGEEVVSSEKVEVDRRPSKADNVIFAPSFDHAVKDPCPNAIRIVPENSIVLLEGSWLLYDQEPWSDISGLVDETWFVDVDPSLARDRIARRHLQSGIENIWEAAVRRAEENDLANGELIRSSLVEPAVRVFSVDSAVAS